MPLLSHNSVSTEIHISQKRYHCPRTVGVEAVRGVACLATVLSDYT